MRIRRSKIAAALAGAGLLCTALAVLTPGTASAAGPVVTNYGSYPAGIIPAGCSAQGNAGGSPAILTGVVYKVSGTGSGTYFSLASIPAVSSDTVITMSWKGFAAGCEAAGISLSVSYSPSGSFSPGADQRLTSAN